MSKAKAKADYTPNPHYGWCIEQQCLVYLSTGEPVGTDELLGDTKAHEPTITGIMHYRVGNRSICGDQNATLATTDRGRVDCPYCFIKMKRRGMRV